MKPFNNDPQLGQILPSSYFGKALTDEAQKAKMIVEVGTWKGQGSTICLFWGMPIDAHLWSVEQDEAMWKEAKGYWGKTEIISLIHGRVEDVAKDLPLNIDLLLLDGGEERGWEDFELLGPRAKVIALDDTMEKKNKRVREELLKSWETLYDEPKDRYGWGIWRRK